MLKILNDLKNPFPYSLEDIAELSGVGSIHSTRKYLQKVLPATCYNRSTDGRGAKYDENTLNSFRVLKMLLDKRVLRWEQITAVMTALGQELINRIARGEEPLKIHLAVADGDGVVNLSDGPVDTTGEEKVMLLKGNEVETISVNEEGTKHLTRPPQPEPWKSWPITNRLEVRYKGNLSSDQMDELRVTARILRAIVEQK